MLQLFGTINPPLDSPYFKTTGGNGLFMFISNVLKLFVVIAGIFMVIQIISAGFQYISANGDSKATAIAWNKIWQSILGLIIIASAFVLAALVERLTGLSILNFQIYGPDGPHQ